MNRVFLCGNLGKDTALRQTQSGMSVCNFSIATQKYKAGKDGQKGEQLTEWHNIVAWGKLGENCSKYLKKGSECLIEGELQTRKWQDKQGATHYTTEINANNVRFLGGSKGDVSHAPTDATFPPNDGAPVASSGGNPFSEDIPFMRLSEWG